MSSSVLFLLSSLTIGGSERKTVRLANALAERSCRVCIAYLNGPHTLLPQIAPGVQAVCLHRRGKFSLRSLRELLRLIRANDIQTVVAINLYAGLYAVCAKWLLPPGRLRVQVSINTTEFVTRKEARQMMLYRWILRAPDRIIFGAEAQRALWCERYSLGDPGSHAVLYNGVDTDWFDRSRVTPAMLGPRPPMVLVSVGKFRKEKGQVDLIRAVHALRRHGVGVELVLVGDGPERAALEAEVVRLGLGKRVHMPGEVADVRPFLAAADLFVLPSTSETFSNATLEAMSMGLPIISSAIGGMREMLAHGGGLTYPPGDVPALTTLITDLAGDRSAREELARAARRAAVERFGFARMIEVAHETFSARSVPRRERPLLRERTSPGE